MYRFMRPNPQVQEKKREILVPKKVHQSGEQSMYKRRVDFFSFSRTEEQSLGMESQFGGNRQHIVVRNVFREPLQCL